MLYVLISREDNTRLGMVTALKGLMSADELGAGNQFIKQRLTSKSSPEPRVEEAAEPEVQNIKLVSELDKLLNKKYQKVDKLFKVSKVDKLLNKSIKM